MVLQRVVAAYRWRRLLASCRLDPDDLPRPVESPTHNDFIIAGCPRSGTSLLAAVLFQPPHMIVSMEPWDGLRMPPAQLFSSIRAEIEEEGALRRGRLDIGAVDAGRVQWQRDAATRFVVDPVPDFLLGVKWPCFWRYLDLLPDIKFLVTLRHPLDVISSFERVGGRLGRGLDYDVAFNAKMNDELSGATTDPETRRVLMYEYINGRVLPHLASPNVKAVRFERWFDDREALLDELAAFLGLPALDPKVKIEMPTRREPPSPRLIELIGTRAPSAKDLGYEV